MTHKGHLLLGGGEPLDKAKVGVELSVSLCSEWAYPCT